MDLKECFFFAESLYRFFKDMQGEILKEFANPTILIEKGPGDYVGALDMMMHRATRVSLPKLRPVPVIGEEVEEGETQFPWPPPFGDFWLRDELDGTDNFYAGFNDFGHQGALFQNWEAVFSYIYVPIDEQSMGNGFYFAGKGLGAWQRLAGGNKRPLSVTSKSDLSRAFILLDGKSKDLPKSDFLNQVKLVSERNRNGFSFAVSTTRMALGGFRPLGVDAIIAQNCKPWDIFPGKLIIEEAQHGKVVDWVGKPLAIDGIGNAIFYNGNDALIAQILSKHVSKYI
ncbi:MAG: inositol monophosphatase family protein [Candidatus Giovannonibacteria bacterium]|nr:inositol monophosphatase family protein [Candidatus Giovannonibacteria bacterium]